MLAIVQDRKLKMAIPSESDSYLWGNGHAILGFLQACDIERFDEQVRRLNVLDEEQIAARHESLGLSYIRGSMTEKQAIDLMHYFPEINTDTGVQLLYMIYYDRIRHVVVEPDFAKRTYFCETGYVLDFDDDSFDVYIGGVSWAVKRGYDHGPFAFLRPKEPPAKFFTEQPNYQDPESYVPLCRIARFPFADLMHMPQPYFSALVEVKIKKFREKQRRAEDRVRRDYFKRTEYVMPGCYS